MTRQPSAELLQPTLFFAARAARRLWRLGPTKMPDPIMLPSMIETGAPILHGFGTEAIVCAVDG